MNLNLFLNVILENMIIIIFVFFYDSHYQIYYNIIIKFIFSSNSKL